MTVSVHSFIYQYSLIHAMHYVIFVSMLSCLLASLLFCVSGALRLPFYSVIIFMKRVLILGAVFVARLLHWRRG